MFDLFNVGETHVKYFFLNIHFHTEKAVQATGNSPMQQLKAPIGSLASNRRLSCPDENA